MKRFYALAVAALACVANANAQSEVTEDWDIVTAFEWSEKSSTEGVSIYGATATVKAFSLQIAGLPVSPSGGFSPITLGNGGVLRFFDNPEYAMPSEDTWDENDQMYSDEWGHTWDDLVGYQGSVTELPFDFVIEGEGNEIHLDSYCSMGGTLTGNGSVTIFASNRSAINFVCANPLNVACPTFNGIIYFKSLDGYTCDTISVGGNYRPGVYNSGALGTKAYNASSSVIDLSGLNNPVWKQNTGNSQVIPPIKGNCEILVANFPYVNGAIAMNGTSPVLNEDGTTQNAVFEYDGTWTLGGSTTHDFEMYGNSVAFNGPINGQQRFFYVRSAAEVYFNSEEPSCSGFLQSISQRGTGFTGGTGFADIDYGPNGGRVNTLSAGYPYNTVGEMTWKSIHLYNSNVVRFDFAGDKSDVFHVVNQYHFNPGRNDYKLGFADDFFNTAVPGNYLVIDAGRDSLDAGFSTFNDTIGYEIWDNNGPTYCIRSVHGGEVIIDAVTGEERVAAPGDSIGAASFGNLASKYGATIMDGNRPHYVIKEWGFGTYSDGKSVDERYIGQAAADYDGTYVINPDQVGTWARGAEGYYNDSLAWEAVWEQFKADHPCSDPRTAVGTDDPSVIPGTVTDSIFLTYSLRLNEEGNWVGHAWSWKNGSGSESSVKGYPYAGAITKPYYYYSANTFYLDQSGTVLSPAGDSIAYSFSKQTFPATLYANKLEQHATDVNGADSVYYVNDPASAYKSYSSSKIAVPQADGSVIRYWFDLKNLMTHGVIALCYEQVDGEGNVTKTNAAADGSCTDEEIVNSDQKLDIKTVLKEKHAVASRAIYSIDGKRLNTYVKGLNVVTTKYTDGTIETKKVFFAE